MRRFPAPVAIVTTELDGERFGLTVGSLVSLSLEPPLVGISIGKDSSSHEPIRRAAGWAVSLLGSSQGTVARHFARSGIPPVALWVGVDVREGARGPLVQGAIGWLECRKVSEHDVGDHTIFVGGVESIELGTPAEGLVYRGGEYHPA
jgi:flavin reductase (DIM6/NTAB) family NADH-FMN oxidoreductase RutF